ncbi:MAG: hypothetical protein QW481_05010, partial [Candidatus Methanomethylicia archaeon]
FEVKSKSKLEVKSIYVGGKLESHGYIKFDTINVGGSLKIIEGCEGEKVIVGGKMVVEGPTKIKSMDIGGKADIRGNFTGDNVKIGGKMEVNGWIKISGGISVGGIIRVNEDVDVKWLEVGGKVKARSIIAEEYIDVGGEIETDNGAKAKIIKLGKRGKAKGPLIGGEIHLGRESEVEDIYAENLVMGSESEAENIYVKTAVIRDECTIHGKIYYTEKIEVGRNVHLTFEPQKVQELPKPPL